MLTNVDIYFYLEGQAQKVIGVDYKLVKGTCEHFEQIDKIEKAFVDQTDISDVYKRVVIVLDDHKVIGTFDFIKIIK